MSQTPITVTYSLEEILGEIKQSIKEVNQRLDNIQQEARITNERLTKVEITLDAKFSTLEARFSSIDTKFSSLEVDVKELKGAMRAQIWTLIGVLIAAVSGFVVAVGRLVLSGNP